MKEAFLARMKEYLKDEYPAFLKTLENEMYRGVRFHPLKLTREQVIRLFPYELKPTLFCAESFYVEAEVKGLGNHPLHAGGGIYLQEPSASAAVSILDVQKDDWVLDLCAAPGGKSSQIATKLAHSGLLVANEIDFKRSQILMSNLERLGFGEVIITNNSAEQLCQHCAGWFDKILVDAPCSGEGMMKKHNEAAVEWSIANILSCAERQFHILNTAFDALKENGTLVYSTCTYAMEENEQLVSRILAYRDDIIQIDCEADFGRCGLSCPGMDHQKVRRIFPMDQGEGHFIARFQKLGGTDVKRAKHKKTTPLSKQQLQELNHIVDMPNGYFDCCNDQLYYRKTMFIDMGKLRVLRQGILLGTWTKNRFEPHHHLFMSALLKSHFKQIFELNNAQWTAFQGGEELMISGYRGYVALAWNNLIVGFGKGDGTVIKNKYPKGLRVKR